jgi:prepilin-type processing-associated H-X9-DG protein
MRILRLTALCLFILTLSLPLFQEFFPGFIVASQNTGSSLTAPTNVIASDNHYATKVVVSWDAVRGATQYRVFRNTANDPPTATSLGTTVEGLFADATAAVGQTYFFWVRAENGNVVSSLSQADQGIRANGVALPLPLPPLNPPPVPPGNPITAAKAFLGKTLFWDEQLSSTRTVACGSCHFATNGGSDLRTSDSARSTNPGADAVLNTADDVFGSPGVPSNNVDGSYNWSTTYGFAEQVTGRKSKSYVDAGYANVLFWDGRASGTFTDPISGAVVLQNGAALESQVLGPPVNSSEMAHTLRDWNNVASRVAASKPLALSPSIPAGLNEWIGGRSYPELFLEVFGSLEVTPARIAMAIATFERTVYSDRTPFDSAVSQITPLTPAESRGQGVFNQSRCNLCHAGTLLSDNQFHNIGLRPQTEDPGRFAVTGNQNNLGEFRTPSLRNVALRAPYMHNGRLATLTDVVEFYNRGGDFDAPNIDRNRIRPLNLSPQQKADLIAFLSRPLTDPRVAAATTPFDRPTLYFESQRVPLITGTGTAGSGASIPQVTAIEPPLLGNPSFTVGVSKALGQAQAVLVIDKNDPGNGSTIPATGSFARVTTQLGGFGAGQGFTTLSLQIPNDAALLGSTFFGRWYVSDANAPGGVAVTPAFKMTIFGSAPLTSPNPIDDARQFVKQQYRDFLNREADQAGENFWTDNITKCGDPARRPAGQTEAQCIDHQRETTSAAFFLSPEFQYTGYYVYRFYKGALGRQPTLSEFTADMQFVGAGIIVNSQLSAAKIEANKAAYASQFVGRPEFSAIYGGLGNQQYVDKLFETTTINASAADKAALVNGLNSNVTRASVLQKVVDGTVVISEGNQQFTTTYGQAFYNLEFNCAFVQMEYFGYLRRDQDAPGYAFWLGKVNLYGNYLDAEMVKSFIVSPEYRSRFGQP